jgi:hypothetical protein
MSDIATLLATHGESVTLNSVSISADTWGHTYSTATGYAITSIVLIMNGDSEEVKAGVLAIGDLIAFVDPSVTNVSYLALGAQILFNNETYKIVNIIKEHGVNPGDTWSHYEIHAKKVD